MSDLTQTISNLVSILLGLVGVVGVGYFIYGAYMYLTASGAPNQMERGKAPEGGDDDRLGGHRAGPGGLRRGGTGDERRGGQPGGPHRARPHQQHRAGQRQRRRIGGTE